MSENEKQYDGRGRLQEVAWYTLVVFPEREKKICERLNRLAETERYKGQIKRALVPTYVEIDGRGKPKEKVIYTQYVFVEMILNDDTYHAVKIEGVRHILGDTNGPTAIKEHEVAKILELAGETMETKSMFKIGDRVQVTDKSSGAFYLQIGEVTEVNNNKKEITIMIDIFGRETPLSIGFDKVQLQKNLE